MAFEDEEIQQQELSQNINDNDNSNTDVRSSWEDRTRKQKHGYG